MSKIFDRLPEILGSTFGVVWLILCLASLPLNIVAGMRIFGWEWTTAALVAVFGGTLIPIIGQIGYFAGTVTGAYFLIAAGFNWSVATGAHAQQVTITQLSPQKFHHYKMTVLQPKAEEACRQMVKIEYATADGNVPAIFDTYCACNARARMSVLTQDDFAYLEKYNTQPDNFDARLLKVLKAQCVPAQGTRM